MTDPSAAELDQLGEIFGFHPLALEDTAHFGQRPKLDGYRDYGGRARQHRRRRARLAAMACGLVATLWATLRLASASDSYE